MASPPPPVQPQSESDSAWDLDAVDWLMLIAIAGLVAFWSASGPDANNSPAQAIFLAFPVMLFVFYCWYAILKMLVMGLAPPQAQAVLTKVVGSLSTGLFGILIGRLFG